MLRFDGFNVDLAARETVVQGRVVHLEPQAFDVLAYLIDHRDRVVPHAEILDAVWGSGFVTESALTTRIKEIRRALDDDGRRQRVIRNVRGRGYRFVAPAVLGSSLMGRDADIAAVVDRVRSGHPVTIVGPGGVGKSALATAVADRLAGQYPEGVWHVALDDLAVDNHLLPHILRSTATADAGAPPDATLDALAARRALLVLDNAEPVIDQVCAIVDRLAGGDLAILITSRERLGCADEALWPLLPLSDAVARDLLLTRIAARVPSLDLDQLPPESVSAIVRVSDGLPLALDMAAGMLASVTPADLVDLMAERPDLVASPNRSVAARHSTLESVIDHSLELLPETLRQHAIEMHCFAAPAALDAVAGVIGADVADMRALADRSLVRVDLTGPRTRYLTMQTVRARTRKLIKDPDALARRHADWFTGRAEVVAEQLSTNAEASAASALQDMSADLRSAVRWSTRADPGLAVRACQALGPFAATRLWGEPAQWAATLLDAGHGLDILNVIVAAEAALRGDFVTAETAARSVLEGDDQRARGRALEVLADVALYRGDLQAAYELAGQVSVIGDRLGDEHVVTMGVVGQALAQCYRGEPDTGWAVVDAAPVPSAPSDRGWLAYARGECSVDPVTAMQCFHAAIDLANSVGNVFLGGVAGTSLVSAVMALGDLSDARRQCVDVVGDFLRVGNVTHLITLLRNSIDILTACGHPEAALAVARAVSGEGLKPTYGDEAATMQAATERAWRALGSTGVAVEPGPTLSVVAAARLAAGVLAQP